ncbi:hypothetical protein HX860_03240 [Marine Group I thaumarchaeote]|jgi:hypothetical protein|uniref:Uncharacterized protein n=1 Tax=Marine Group I thaumarchaeote TaxID=2511932 RepID=A0A7K4NJV3_9ARCH|nr:MAG: hypothetical protein DSN69_01240 [Nitrosopumilus sp. YT1]NMI82902.1 hypothetical protein [Candidatus Nitrosopumilus sp. MTA1]NWJ20072.1 hypothetical protein [Marine Group I thaumarchaeote]NWJ27983.1 hypothetical protein [Marine Group I thaumarchaeote]NWJ29436.1 hypothetical protein [Marine Group I thaumarchaeote]
MLSKRTIIGLIAGIAIITIGGASLITHIGTLTINENYVVEVGDSASYTIPAPMHTSQSMTITGDAFDLKLESPGNELQIPKTSYKNELLLEWTHLEDGETKIQIQNTGNTELLITGVLIRSSDPIWFTYDVMVMITGIVIIGFSMGFTMRKPKGF